MPTPSLPPEILDSIIDTLHDKPETLKKCCLVAKSWVPRTRKYLFADIQFHSSDELKSWKMTFPDPANSPAHHAHSLLVGCPQSIVTADADEGGWIRAFSSVSSLVLDRRLVYLNTWRVSLLPLYRFSPTLKSLHVHSLLLPSPQLFTFVLSCPLLEDLTVEGLKTERPDSDDDPHKPWTIAPSAPPPLTGTLDLEIGGEIEGIVRRLLDLPNGIHFQKLVFSQTREEDIPWIMKMLVRCSESLEYLDVMCDIPLDSEPISIDLSKVTRLKSAVFRVGSCLVGWIVVALRTITLEHRDLCGISIHVYLVGSDVMGNIGEVAFGRWLDLDRVLVEFWESRSIRPRVNAQRVGGDGKDTEYCVRSLLPEAAKRGILVLI